MLFLGHNVPRRWCLFWDTKNFFGVKKTFLGLKITFFWFTETLLGIQFFWDSKNFFSVYKRLFFGIQNAFFGIQNAFFGIQNLFLQKHKILVDQNPKTSQKLQKNSKNK